MSWISLVVPAAWAQLGTSTSLVISSTPPSTTVPYTVPYKTPFTLTATVTDSTGAAVTSGLVLFCDAPTPTTVCENNSPLALVQVTAPTLANPTSTATLKLGSGPLGNHSFKAVYLANNLYTSSTSNTVSYTVAGTYASSTTIGSTGAPGNYTLTGTVAGVGAVISPGPTGQVNFLDTSNGNNPLSIPPQNLGSVTLSTTFAEASNSPFAIAANTTKRSVAIASAYLDADNNLDVVTGDYAQTITVLLGNGDGSFQTEATHRGLPRWHSHEDPARRLQPRRQHRRRTRLLRRNQRQPHHPARQR